MHGVSHHRSLICLAPNRLKVIKRELIYILVGQISVGHELPDPVVGCVDSSGSKKGSLLRFYKGCILAVSGQQPKINTVITLWWWGVRLRKVII